MSVSSSLALRYCTDLSSPLRRQTKVVPIGDLALGGSYPIRLQSMTTTDTMDIESTVAQVKSLAEVGSEYVRLAVPSQKEAEALEIIKKKLHEQGYRVPLIADIHFTPKAAEISARYVEKIRINPGNYADKKRFQQIEYNDASYQEELQRIADRFTPLLRVCKAEGRALRIGTNHGSLSDRIMSRYGDTPLGMVESALEFLRICREMSFHDVVLSMKASQPKVMLQAYRLLVQRLEEEELGNYPLHLGVTEAGDGEDARIKSALGIGTLLAEGLGDTIRVSLTEAPQKELPVAKALRNRYEIKQISRTNRLPPQTAPAGYSPFDSNRQKSDPTLDWGAGHLPRVVVDVSAAKALSAEVLFAELGHHYKSEIDKWESNDQAADYIYTSNWGEDLVLPRGLSQVLDHKSWQKSPQPTTSKYPLFYASEPKALEALSEEIVVFVLAKVNEVESICKHLSSRSRWVLWIERSPHENYIDLRNACFTARALVSVPLGFVLKSSATNKEELTLEAATDLGGCLASGYGDGLMIKSSSCSLAEARALSFDILQAARMRLSKTEYIACPSCGRTLFDLEETTARIRNRTSHLKGLKIGIMGCIVNGPGEMADADYGYVGAGKDKITLYRAQEVVSRNIPSSKAVEALIELIQSDGKWQDAPSV